MQRVVMFGLESRFTITGFEQHQMFHNGFSQRFVVDSASLDSLEHLQHVKNCEHRGTVVQKFSSRYDNMSYIPGQYRR